MVDKSVLHPFSYVLDTSVIKKICAIAQLKTFKKNDIIIDIDQYLKHIPLLIKGNIKVLREDKNGEELLLYVLESGDTCAMSLTSCLSVGKSKVRAIAESDIKVLMLSIDDIQEWFHTDKSWRNFILQSYQTRFDEMLETIDALAFLKMDERLFKYLTDKVKLTASTELSITHQNIAEDMHTSRVVISRLLKQLENENKIKLGRHKIQVLVF